MVCKAADEATRGGKQATEKTDAQVMSVEMRNVYQTNSRSASAPLCRECGGRRIIKTSAGYLPCPKCVPWSQRPDYSPGQLISDKDLDLGEIEEQEIKRNTGKPKKRTVVMTEERRLAIQMAMKNRGPLDQDHKRKISNSIRAKYAENPSLRQKGKPKRCSVCGKEGHNKKTCPEVGGPREANMTDKDGKQRRQITSKKRKEGGKDASTPKRVIRCGICGEEGHNRKSCPNIDKVKQSEKSPSTAAELIFEQERKVILAESEPKMKRGDALYRKQRETVAPIDSKRPLRSLRGSDVSVSNQGSILFPLPVTQGQCVQQAAAASRRAWDDGIRRQNLELLLPQASGLGGGWPGGIKQQFRAALPMVESLLLILKNVKGLEGRITAEFLDEVDCVGAWQSERLAAVVFPTAETIPALQKIDDALSGQRLTLVINPQWQLIGQVISDFGFGNSRRKAEAFVGSLEYVYYLQRFRIMGDEVRVLRCYPGQWQIHCMGNSARDSRLLSVERERPTYDRLVEILKSDKSTSASKSWIDRFLSRKSFDEIATYSEDDVSSPDPSSSESSPSASLVYSPTAENIVDIVTGEIIQSNSTTTTDNNNSDGSSSSSEEEPKTQQDEDSM